jgi:hypothetical protein
VNLTDRIIALRGLNPSYVNRAWSVDSAVSGAEVTVTWLAALGSVVAPARSAREVDLR